MVDVPASYVSLVEGNQGFFALLSRFLFSRLPNSPPCRSRYPPQCKKTTLKKQAATNKKGASPEEISKSFPVLLDKKIYKRRKKLHMAIVGWWSSCDVFFLGGEGWGKSVLTTYLPPLKKKTFHHSLKHRGTSHHHAIRTNVSWKPKGILPPNAKVFMRPSCGMMVGLIIH